MQGEKVDAGRGEGEYFYLDTGCNIYVYILLFLNKIFNLKVRVYEKTEEVFEMSHCCIYLKLICTF